VIFGGSEEQVKAALDRLTELDGTTVDPDTGTYRSRARARRPPSVRRPC
jgi:hypothetical protein